MAVEYIARVDLNTDGDWSYTEEMNNLYYGKMNEDYQFDGRIAIFDNIEDAIKLVREVLACAAGGGLYRSPERELGSDSEYIDRIKKILDLFGSDECREALVHGTASAADDPESFCGVEFTTAFGNWSCEASVLVRTDGRISHEVYFYYV